MSEAVRPGNCVAEILFGCIIMRRSPACVSMWRVLLTGLLTCEPSRIEKTHPNSVPLTESEDIDGSNQSLREISRIGE